MPAATLPRVTAQADKERFDDRVDHIELVHSIRRMDLLAISGGRVVKRDTGITLPVGQGYYVFIDLALNDTYTVRRVLKRSGEFLLKGEEAEVYVDVLSGTAYRASCYVNVKFGDHDPMA